MLKLLEKFVVVKYLRLSIDDGDKIESDSIENQRNLLDYNIKKLFPNNDVEVIEIVDDGYTGTNMNRPGMRKLLILAETREINCIIVKDFSRFARDYVELGTYVDKTFPIWNIRFISLNDGYDSINFCGITGGIDVALKNITYTMYSRDLSEKVKSSRKVISKKGQFIAPYAFYGYLKAPDDKRKLIIDPVASEVVKRIFSMRVSGIKPSQIAIIFNKEQIPTPAIYKKSIDPLCREWNNVSGYSYWSASIIGNILRDERYTGKLISGKFERITVGSTKVRAVPKEKQIVVDNAMEAIISQETFDSVQTLNKKIRNPITSKISLQSLVRCGGCGHVMSPSNVRGKIHKFFCPYRKYTENNKCFQGSISENNLVDYITKLIMIELQKSVDVQKAKDDMKSKLKRNEIKIKEIVNKIEQEKRKKLEDYILLTKGELTEDEFVKRREIIDCNITKYAEQEKALTFENVSKEDIMVTDLFSRYIGVEEINREVLQDLIKAIYVYPDNRIEIVWNYKEKIS